MYFMAHVALCLVFLGAVHGGVAALGLVVGVVRVDAVAALPPAGEVGDTAGPLMPPLTASIPDAKK